MPYNIFIISTGNSGQGLLLKILQHTQQPFHSKESSGFKHQYSPVEKSCFTTIKLKSPLSVTSVLLTVIGNCSLPGSSGHGISQARILEQVAISFSKSTTNAHKAIQFQYPTIIQIQLSRTQIYPIATHPQSFPLLPFPLLS